MANRTHLVLKRFNLGSQLWEVLALFRSNDTRLGDVPAPFQLIGAESAAGVKL
ncbi:MAG: hypothetical protein AAGC95_07590 [Pseudomonadota bacterium]